MYTFPELLKKVREESELTQDQLAKAVGVSTILISMVETGHKEVSKSLVLKLASALKVSPNSIMPFVFFDQDGKTAEPTGIEKTLFEVGERFQRHLIKVKAKGLREDA